MTLEVYVTNNVSGLFGVTNKVFIFHFSFSQKLTHELGRRLPRFDSFTLSKDREPIGVVVLLLRGYLAAADWKNCKQSGETLVGSQFLYHHLSFSFRLTSNS